MPENPQFYTTGELAPLVYIPEATLRALALVLASGNPRPLIEFPMPSKYGRDYLWPREAVDTHLAKLRGPKP